MQRLEAAEAPPMTGDGRIAQKGLEQGFVVSFQRDELGRKRIAREALENPARIGAAIDVIADRHGQAVVHGRGLKIAADLAHEAVEQVGAAMNVADHVEAAAVRERHVEVLSDRRGGGNGSRACGAAAHSSPSQPVAPPRACIPPLPAQRWHGLMQSSGHAAEGFEPSMQTDPSAVEGAENAAALAQGERWYVVHTLPVCETRAQMQ